MIEAAEYTFNIRNIEINLHKRLSFTALANILQECASMHAAELGASTLDLMQSGHTWVLSRLKISMTERVKLGENLVVRTWPEGATGVRAYRTFRIYNGRWQEIGTADSVWLILDIEARKAIPVPQSIAALRGGNADIHHDFRRKIPDITQGDLEYRTKVGWHDLDINRHVNNNHYLRWIVESFPFEFLRTHRMAASELVYLGESHYGDNILVRTSRETDNTFIHNIENAGNGGLMRAVTTWMPL